MGRMWQHSRKTMCDCRRRFPSSLAPCKMLKEASPAHRHSLAPLCYFILFCFIFLSVLFLLPCLKWVLTRNRQAKHTVYPRWLHRMFSSEGYWWSRWCWNFCILISQPIWDLTYFWTNTSSALHKARYKCKSLSVLFILRSGLWAVADFSQLKISVYVCQCWLYF